MTQSRATSPTVIYETLSDDSEFMSYVGKYKFTSSNSEFDSISILTPGQPLPNLESQTGLEVVIHDTGILTRKDYLTSPSDTLASYQVYLIVWPTANGETMTNAAARIMQIFSNAKTVSIVPTPNDLTALVQTMVLIPENAAIMI